MITPGELWRLFRAVRPILKRAILSGQIVRPQCVLTQPDPDVLCEYDVEIPLSEASEPIQVERYQLEHAPLIRAFLVSVSTCRRCRSHIPPSGRRRQR